MYKFIGPSIWKTMMENDIQVYLPEDQEKEVTVLRSILFFYGGQKTTISKIMTYFTAHAIAKLVHDKFIEIHD